MDPLDYRFVTAGDLRFRVSITNEGGGRGLALLLHGFPELAFSWRFQIPALAELGYEVWAPDLRGYGGSDKPRGVASYELDHLVADVGALIDASGRDRVLLVGHDWGAAIAWQAAMQQVRPLDRLIIMNVPHPECMRRELRTFRQLRRSWYMFFFQLPWLPEKLLGARHARAIGQAFAATAGDASRFPPEVTDVYRAAATRPGALTPMLNYYRAVFRNRKRSAGPIPTVVTPTLMVWGEADTALGKEATEGTDAFVSDLSIRFLPGVSHWVQQEAPEAVNTIVTSWLDDDPVPQADDLDLPRLADPAVR